MLPSWRQKPEDTAALVRGQAFPPGPAGPWRLIGALLFKSLLGVARRSGGREGMEAWREGRMWKHRAWGPHLLVLAEARISHYSCRGLGF